MKSKRIYLACPYAHDDPRIRAHRVDTANRYAAMFMDQGYRVFSPLSHSTTIAPHCKPNENKHDYWMKQDLWILTMCDEMFVLCLDGWMESKGLKDEIELATLKNIPIGYITL